MINPVASPGTLDQMCDPGQPSTARALTLEPRRAVLQALRRWAAEQDVHESDLAALDRVFAMLASVEDGPDLDLAMRAARRRVIDQARRRRRLLDAN